MQRRYVTTDVFTDQLFAGNPLAAVLSCAAAPAPGRWR